MMMQPRASEEPLGENMATLLNLVCTIRGVPRLETCGKFILCHMQSDHDWANKSISFRCSFRIGSEDSTGKWAQEIKPTRLNGSLGEAVSMGVLLRPRCQSPYHTQEQPTKGKKKAGGKRKATGAAGKGSSSKKKKGAGVLPEFWF